MKLKIPKNKIPKNPPVMSDIEIPTRTKIPFNIV